MTNRKHTGSNKLRLTLAVVLTTSFLAIPALSWAGPRVILVGPRLRHRPAKIVVAPRSPRHYAVVRVLPNGHKRVVVKGVPYYYHRGVFYRSGTSGFVVVNAPIGFRIGALPDGFAEINIGTNTFYYHNGNYFRWNPDRRVYVVVPAPQGAAVTYLPDGYARVNMGGDIYYKYNGVYYRQEEIDGNLVYVVTEI